MVKETVFLSWFAEFAEFIFKNKLINSIGKLRKLGDEYSDYLSFFLQYSCAGFWQMLRLCAFLDKLVSICLWTKKCQVNKHLNPIRFVLVLVALDLLTI